MTLMLSAKVVGVSFREDYPKDIFGLSKYIINGDYHVDLVREPQNENDSNALAVMKNGNQIGYISKNLASIISPEIDSGTKWYGAVEKIVISTVNQNNPGVILTLWREDD